MLDGNDLRAEFARYLTEHTHTRWGLDAALMHVCRIAYDQGMKDGQAMRPPETGTIERSDNGQPYPTGSEIRELQGPEKRPEYGCDAPMTNGAM